MKPAVNLRRLIHRRPMVVLWGGRPDTDYQFGSVRDKARTARLLTILRMRRKVHAAAVTIGASFNAAGVKEAVQAMERFATAMRDVQKAARI